jgi:glyoxylase-like metal-dependent hydrolase (beta-lactamase superfamily II)
MPETKELILEVIPVGPLQCNCIILGDQGTKEALVVDPGDEPQRILQVLEKHGLQTRMIFHTHAHIDHVGGTAQVQKALEADVAFPPEDRFLYDGLAMQAQFLGAPPPPKTDVTADLKDGQAVAWGKHEGEVLHTPGHSPGSVCLYVPETDVRSGSHGGSEASRQLFPGSTQLPPTDSPRALPLLLAGDTLFWGSIGRTDLWGGSYEEIMKSIRERLLVLPSESLVIPGHGPVTTLEQEKGHNPFLQDLGRF